MGSVSTVKPLGVTYDADLSVASQVEGLDVGRLDVALRGDEAAVTVERLRGNILDGEIEGAGVVDLRSVRNTGFALTWERVDLSQLQPWAGDRLTLDGTV